MAEGKQTPPTTDRQRSSPYPRFSLSQVEKFAQAVFLLGPRNCDIDLAAKKAGYSGAMNGSFFAMRSAASQFGLVVAKNDRISVSEDWIIAFHEDKLQILQRSRQEAIKKPKLYKRLLEKYEQQQIPAEEKLARTIYIDPTFGITKDAAVEAVKVFLESAHYAGALDERNYLRTVAHDSSPVPDNDFDDMEDENGESFHQRATNLSSSGIQSATQSTALRPQREPLTIRPTNDGSSVSIPDGMEKQELTIKGGKKAYFIIPVPLPVGEKERLKQWLDLVKMHIDLTIEEDTAQISRSPVNEED